VTEREKEREVWSQNLSLTLLPLTALPRANGMYYGGEPAAWTTAPAIPDGARFEHSVTGREGGGAGERE